MAIDNRALTKFAAIIASAHLQTGWTGIRRAIPTKGDPDYTLLVPGGQPKEIFLQDPDTGVAIIAYLPASNGEINYQDGDPNNAGLLVRIGYPPGSQQLTVMDSASLGGRQAIGSLSPREAFLNEAWWALLNQIQPLRARTTTPAASTAVAVDGPITVIRPSNSISYYISTANLDLSTTITALTAGQHQLIKLYFDREAGMLAIQAQAATTAVGSLPARDEFGSDSLAGFTSSPNWIDIIPIYLYYGQTAVQEADFYRTYDMRPLFSGSGSGNGYQIDRITTTITIPANAQGNYAEEVVIEDGGELVVDGRLFVGL